MRVFYFLEADSQGEGQLFFAQTEQKHQYYYNMGFQIKNGQLSLNAKEILFMFSFAMICKINKCRLSQELN